MLYKAEQNDASLTCHKNEQTETSDRLVKTSDPLINRLRQHPFSTARSQLYLTRSGKSSSSETRRSRHSIVTARHGPTNPHFQLHVPSPMDPPSKRILKPTLHSAAVLDITDFPSFVDINMIYTFCDTIHQQKTGNVL